MHDNPRSQKKIEDNDNYGALERESRLKEDTCEVKIHTEVET